MPNLITDRTQADVIRANEINKKVYDAWASAAASAADANALMDPMEIAESTLTDAEFAEWLSGLKGAYNYTDLNRVEAAVAELSSVLALNLTTRTNWGMYDVPQKADMNRYISNLQAVKNGFLSSVSIPNVMSALTYVSANNIEKMLLDSFGRLSTHKVWAKKPATVEYDWKYTRDENHELLGTTGTDYQWSFYGGMISAAKELSFDTRNGFNGRAQDVGLIDSKGYYIITGDKCEARQIVSAVNTGNTKDDGAMYEIRYNYTVVGIATRVQSPYCSVIEEDLGRHLVPNNALPNGTLIEGSYEDGYCFVKDGGNYYYYEVIRT